MNLWSEFVTNDRRAITKWKHYFPIYERHFSRWVNTSVTIFEIGVYRGGSLQMWKRYFGPHAVIVGIDIDPNCFQFEEDQIHVRIGDQSNIGFLERVIAEFGVPDIIVDDGSHVMNHVRTSFDFLYAQLSKNGIYLVEDLHTAYWDEYGGGLRRAGTFIEICKDLIDALNADHTRGAVNSTPFTNSTMSMHFYDSVVVFERGVHTGKLSMMTGS